MDRIKGRRISITVDELDYLNSEASRTGLFPPIRDYDLIEEPVIFSPSGGLFPEKGPGNRKQRRAERARNRNR